MTLMTDMLPKVAEYLKTREWHAVPVLQGRKFAVDPLAQGEYNLNYLISSGPLQLIFRVNIGTQINRDDQILYEYRALELLAQSGVTPRPYFVDDTRQVFEQGILIMEYLPGQAMDYSRDLWDAAGLFATIHQIGVPEEKNHLIREDAPEIVAVQMPQPGGSNQLVGPESFADIPRQWRRLQTTDFPDGTASLDPVIRELRLNLQILQHRGRVDKIRSGHIHLEDTTHGQAWIAPEGPAHRGKLVQRLFLDQINAVIPSYVVTTRYK